MYDAPAPADTPTSSTRETVGDATAEAADGAVDSPADPAPARPADPVLLGPATRLWSSHLRPTLVVVAGEDPDEVAAGLADAGFPSDPVHQYRCYRAWCDDDIAVVWTGMGSACLEPLLWEVLRRDEARTVQRVLLVGTAGTLPGLPVGELQPYWIHVAKPVWQLLDDAKDSLLPKWPAKAPLPTAMAVSTDRFYGFSPEGQDDVVHGETRAVGPSLEAAWRLHKNHPALVDMETAAFFHFCDRFGAPWFGAIRVPANPVSDLDALPTDSGEAIRIALAAVVG